MEGHILLKWEISRCPVSLKKKIHILPLQHICLNDLSVAACVEETAYSQRIYHRTYDCELRI
jgi:hypothetical protein